MYSVARPGANYAVRANLTSMGRTEHFNATTFRFDAFELDAQRRTLRRSGADVELRPLAFDALSCLVRHAGQVVTKDELITAVWPGLVVTDDSIARCISDIRRALGDVEQKIIKTVPRRGYTLAVPVELEEPRLAASEPAGLAGARTEAVPAGPEATDPGSAPERGLSARRWALGVGAALLSVALAWASWSMRRQSEVAAVRPGLSIVVLPLASDGGDSAQDRLAAALTDEITVDMSRIPETFVIARATADSYRGRSVDPRQVGRELGVRYVLDGGMVRLGDALRLTLQLVDSESGRALWAERIDGEVPDLPALYRRVTGTVARSLDL